jgi:RimJ/RimL family protein N-acetyltransferase
MGYPPGDPIELDVGGGLGLRQISEAHLDQVVAAFADPLIALWNPGPTSPDGPRAAALDWIRMRRDWAARAHAAWGIFPEFGTDLLGSVAIHRINAPQRNAELGYWTVAQARGRGVASAAVIAATRFAFDAFGLYRLSLTHATKNTASCRVAEKAGFGIEGVLREAFIYGDGQRHDEHLHGMLRTDRRPG